MSDFDREAERERLRERYEQDKKERAATERMSELLLQGATMTNAHCSECGDPIFRYDGQEFCATCERPVDRENGSGTDETADAGAEDGGDEPTSVEVTSPRDDTKVVFGDDGTGDTEGDRQQEATDSPHERAEQTEQPPRTGAEQSRRTATEATGSPNQVEPSPRAHESTGEPNRTDTAGSAGQEPNRADAAGRAGQRDTDTTGGVDSARASLVRTLAAFSHRAETTEDPQRAREHLQTAREAAEALAALRQR
jgi:uncharacterized Zn finger protein (UPF0148 family)